MSMLPGLALLPTALVLDKIFEEPAPARHPVCWMGHAAMFWEQILRRSAETPAVQRLKGACALVCMEGCFVVPTLLLVWLCNTLSPLLGFAAATVSVWLCLAPHSLAEHARAVLRHLRRNDLPGARIKLARIVGRETSRLDKEGVVRACVESVAENSTDGVLTTLFWACAGFVMGGFPLAACLPVAHRVANTLDAMWGHKNKRYRFFGTCAARTDDVLGYIPARLSLLFVTLGSLCVRGCDATGAWKTALRFHAAHESPNSAWSEAAFAGALSLRLGGPARYDGIIVNHPWLGTGTPDPTADTIDLATDLMFATTWCCAGILSVLMALSPC